MAEVWCQVNYFYYQQLNRAEDYPKLNQVIILGFLNFKLFNNNPDYATRHLILDEKTNENHFQDFELNFVELPKFTKTLEELKDIKDKWIYFVKNAGNMKMIPKELEEPKELLEAFESAKQMKWSNAELEAYDARGIYIQDERGRIQYALEAGEKIGMEKGEKKGYEKGEKAGIDKGKDEKAGEMAKTMKIKGYPLEEISGLTQIPKEEIEKL